MADVWETGRIVRFDHDRGYGFIAPASGGEDLFVHTNDLMFDKALARSGVDVRFRAESSDRGGKASDVELVSPENAAGNDVLSEREFRSEVTELLLASSASLNAAQILEVRAQLLRFADDHGWIGR